jgi:hypothetical protein
MPQWPLRQLKPFSFSCDLPAGCRCLLKSRPQVLSVVNSMPMPITFPPFWSFSETQDFTRLASQPPGAFSSPHYSPAVNLSGRLRWRPRSKHRDGHGSSYLLPGKVEALKNVRRGESNKYRNPARSFDPEEIRTTCIKVPRMDELGTGTDRLLLFRIRSHAATMVDSLAMRRVAF